MRLSHGGFVLFSRSLNVSVDDLPRCREGFSGRRASHRCGQPQPIFVVYRHDETALAGEIEPVEIIGFRLEDQESRFHVLHTPKTMDR